MKNRILSLATVFALTAFAFAATKDTVTDVNEALQKAKSENKMLFLQYGREACSNCQALRAMVKSGAVQLPKTKFVYADVNCDDAATSKAFRAKFKVSGSTLPFVVVASADGTQLAGRTGYGSAKDFQKLIQEAQKAQKSAGAGR